MTVRTDSVGAAPRSARRPWYALPAAVVVAALGADPAAGAHLGPGRRGLRRLLGTTEISARQSGRALLSARALLTVWELGTCPGPRTRGAEGGARDTDAARGTETTAG